MRTTRSLTPDDRMPEQDPEIARLNAEAEREEEEAQRAILRGFVMAAAGITGIALLAIALRRRRPEPTPPL
jgi:hypothetical protein